MSNLIRNAVNFFRGAGDQQSYSSSKSENSEKSGRVWTKHDSSTTDSTLGTDKNAVNSGINPLYIPHKSTSEKPLLSAHGISNPDTLPEKPKASMEKSGDLFMRILQPLIKAFKERQTAGKNQAAAKTLSEISGNLRADIHGKKSAKLAESIKQNPHSAKLGATLSKFTNRKFKLTTKDSNNLNDYFSRDHIGPGIDALADLHQSGNKESFKQALSSLTPHNYTKVSQQLNDLNKGDILESMLEVQQDIDRLNQNIHVLAGEIKSNSDDSETIEGLIEKIKSTALEFCPENASQDSKQVAVHQALANVLDLLGDMPEKQNTVKAKMEKNILAFAGIDSFDKLSELYSDPDRVDTANTAIAMLADADPDKAGKVLNQVIKKSNKSSTKDIFPVAKAVIEKLDTSKKRAQLVGGALKSEIEFAEGEGTLLRGESAATALLRVYNGLHVTPHFENSSRLKDAMQDLPDVPVKEYSSEKNETFISEINVQNIQNHATIVLNAIRDTATDPNNEELNEFYAMCQDIQATLQSRFGEKPARTGALNLLFLRGLNPKLAAATFADLDSKKRQNATVIAKIIQNMANEIPFGGDNEKEPYMLAFNDYVQSYISDHSGPLGETQKHLSGH